MQPGDRLFIFGNQKYIFCRSTWHFHHFASNAFHLHQIMSNYITLCQIVLFKFTLFHSEFQWILNGFCVDFLWMLFSPIFTIRQIVYCFSAISPNIFRRIFFFFFPRKKFLVFVGEKLKMDFFSGFLAVIVGIEDDLNSIFRNRTSSFFDEWFE